MRIYLLFVAGSLLLSIGCFNYEVQYDGPPDLEEEITELPKSLVYVSGGRVFLSNHFGLDSLIINTENSVEIASINNSHTKVLFKESGADIVEYDIESGVVTRSIPNSSEALFFDYHPDNTTVFHYTLDGMLTIDGATLYPENPLNLRYFFPPNASILRRVHGLTILPNNQIFMSVYYEGAGVFSALVVTDGLSLLDWRAKFEYFQQLRMNVAATEITGTTKLGWDLQLHDIRIQNYDDERSSSNTIFGTPHSYSNDNFGYYVQEDGEIRIPNSTSIFPPFGDITSIDY